MSDWQIVDVEGVLLEALTDAGLSCSSLIRVNPQDVRDADLERMPYVHVMAVEGGEESGPWRMDPFLVTCYGRTQAQAFDLARSVIRVLEQPLWSPRYGLVDCCEIEGPARGDDSDNRVQEYLLRVFAESRRGPNPPSS